MIRNSLLSILLALYPLLPLFSQVTWHNVDSLYQPLPPAMHIYFTNDSLDGKPNRAFYVIADLKDKSLQFTVDTTRFRGMTPSQFYTRNNHPLLVVNCTFFSLANRKNLNIVIKEGKLLAENVQSVFDPKDHLYHYVTRSALGINHRSKADVAWIYSDTIRRKSIEMSGGPLVRKGNTPFLTREQLLKDEPQKKGPSIKKWKQKTAVGGGPTLITNGKINITNNEERMFAGERIKEKHPRTAMGYTSAGQLVVMVIEGRFPGKAEGATLNQEATMLLDLGCYEALNLDGGGSSCMLINGKQTITPCDKTGQRPVPAVFLIK